MDLFLPTDTGQFPIHFRKKDELELDLKCENLGSFSNSAMYVLQSWANLSSVYSELFGAGTLSFAMHTCSA